MTGISKLKQENRIDLRDAGFIKLLSSNFFVSFEQSPDSIINQHGNIQEADIKLIFKVSSNKDIYIVLVSTYLGFGHSFKYDLSKKKLTRLTNKDGIILSAAEDLKFQSYNKQIIILNAENKYGSQRDIKKYFVLNIEDETFVKK